MLSNLTALILSCAPNVAPETLKAIIKVESNGNPIVLGLNKGYRLRSQPKDESQAKAWATYLEQNNYNFDVGLAQINIKNIHKYGYKASDLLDPCLNIKISAKILSANYKSARNVTNSDSSALARAISAYNTGNFNSGFKNGYVAKVYAAANSKTVDLENIPPITNTSSIEPSNNKVVVTKKIKKSTTSSKVNQKNDDSYGSSILLYKRSHNAAASFY